jgi:hypothetical protein
MNDLAFYGGLNGVVFGNQQFTVRNLTFYNAVTAIDQIWDWGWTYTGISINNCTTGLNMAAGGTAGQSTGSVTFLDSSFTNTKVAIVTAHNASSFPATAGSLILENIVLTNTPVAVQGPQGTVLAGGSLTISGWGEGHEYTPIYKKSFENSITKFSRPTELTKNGQYYARSKPQYQASPLSQFVSVRTAGAKGNGVTDDTAAINKVLKSAAAASQIVFFDAGTYKVTSTITIPPGSKVVGESYSVIMGSRVLLLQHHEPTTRCRCRHLRPKRYRRMVRHDRLHTRSNSRCNLDPMESRIHGGFSLRHMGRPHSYRRLRRLKSAAGTMPNNPQNHSRKQELYRSVHEHVHRAVSHRTLHGEQLALDRRPRHRRSQAETQITVYTGRGLILCIDLRHDLDGRHGRRAPRSVPIPVREHEERLRGSNSD